ncbi:MAG: hypothetical protein RJA36_2795 [Pseudomonadota bacterium]|jgi:DNA-binding transcriptional LysR family regulator
MARLHRLPPLHALAAFESAARLGGFAPAAAELCITPSAVSHRIRQLEALLGEPLFERLSTGVRLNQAGQRMLIGVREAFDKLAHLVAPDDARVTRLTVGSPPTFARNILIPRLSDFYQLWPDIEIEVFVVAPMQDKPERHDVDIRIGQPPFDERRCAKLFDDKLQVLAAPSYLERLPLRQPADLARAELLRSPLAPWKDWFMAAGLDWPEPRRGTAFSDLGMLLEAAASGMGVALSVACLAEHWVKSGQLVPLFDVEAQAVKTYYALVDHDKALRPEVMAFSDWLRTAFG